MTKFPFPYEPWAIQLDFMQNLYDTIQNEQIGLFESPTGTGKSLSIISSSLYWLEQEKNKPEEVIISEQLQPFLLKIIKDDPQWMKDATINKHKKDIIHNLQLRNTIKQQKNQTLQKIRAQKQQCKFKKQRFVTPLQNEDNDDFLINQDDQNRHLIEIPEERSSPEVESLPKIIYAARTHSQLQQFIHEIKKTKYNETKAITLASRKTLCINTTVSNLKDLPLINDKCMDLQKTKSLNCFCRGETKEHDEQMLLRYSDEAQALIQDIEDLKLLGKELKTCPYYGTRQAVIEADVVCVPYNLLFQESARKSSGIDLKNAVVIIDEAHNAIDAINNIHSILVGTNQLTVVLQQLDSYYNTYKQRLSGKNSLYIKQITLFCNRIMNLNYNGDGAKENMGLNIKQGTTEESSKMYLVNDFVTELDLENLNLFKLLNFLEESNLSNKLLGFTNKNQKDQKEVTIHVKSRGTQPEFISKHTSPLRQIQDLIRSLATPDEDGRIILSREKGTITIKYLLLNPSNVFSPIIEQSKAVIFAGGTMEPITDFVQQLLPDYVERIHYFSCGHGNSNLTKVIPNTQLLTISLPTGPSGMALKYSYEFRNNPVLVLLINKINETGLIIANYTKTVPNGIVVFFPSYKYLKVVYEHWKATGISTRIEKQKTIFLESNEQKENTEDILTKYSDCIKSGRGALLLAVVGGKLGEGINFSDELGRMVIMIGLPFANIKSPELIEKMKFLDKQGQSGSEYYENICMKQVNQCIGRAIRHLNDYAVIVLLDQRYKTDRIKMKLPKWIRDGGINEQGFGKTFGLVSKFFKDNSSRFGSNS